MTSTFAATLRRYREGRGLRQIELARRAGVTPTAVCLLEQGKRNPSLPMLGRLADALGLDDGERRTFVSAAGFKIGERP